MPDRVFACRRVIGLRNAYASCCGCDEVWESGIAAHDLCAPNVNTRSVISIIGGGGSSGSAAVIKVDSEYAVSLSGNRALHLTTIPARPCRSYGCRSNRKP